MSQHEVAPTAEHVALATWSRLVEPGDAMAQAAVQAMGPCEALQWLESATAAEIPPQLTERVERWRQRLVTADIRRELAMARHVEAHVVIPSDDEWPAGLDDLGAEAPLALWVRGHVPPLARSIAIVGARAATRYGERAAAELAVGAADHGVVIVSGGAYGIDAAAHRGALSGESADDATVAVLAGGVDRLYPSGNESLLRRIVEVGAVISELPPVSAPTRHRFLARNRLIAAMTSATVVVEASHRSGARSTANHASRLLRPVGAVPGPITSAQSAGCHAMLRDGQAMAVTSAQEMIELIEVVGHTHVQEPISASGPLDGLPEDQARVLDALPLRAAVSVQSIAAAAGMAEHEVRGALGLLELAGKVRRSADRWART